MPDLLVELLSEEIPARMQRKAAGDFRQLVTDALVDAGLVYEAAREYWTPRRLAIDLRGLSIRSADVVEERKGPRIDAPDAAVEGFLRSAGLSSRDEAEIHSDPKKGDYYVARLRRPGRPAEEILAEILPKILNDFPWPKSMRWGAASARPGAMRWVRPLQSILCTFGPETEDPQVIDFEIGGLRSGNSTCGHRFHAPEKFAVRRFEDYATRLAGARVMLDPARRKDTILTDARNLAFANGLELVEDDALLEEVTGLVEWPVVLMGQFDAAFLEIPAEVIRLTIKTNQKCFVLRDGAGALCNRFILVANVEAHDGGKEIVRGNERVVRARLADAEHFYAMDQAALPDLDRLEAAAEGLGLDLARPLDQRMARLDALNVTFHARLGTQGARVRRIADFAERLAAIVGADRAMTRRAALLAKADLQTEVVGEFPELQGVMGRKYALLQGEPEEIAAAIEEHYRPQGPADLLPQNRVAVAVALADKLDMLAGFWAISEKPTGSKDPYALRRAALGVIRIVLEHGVRLPILSLLRDWETTLAPEQVRTGPETAAARNLDLIAFLHERLKVHLREEGRRHDLIGAVLTADADDLVTIVERVAALEAFLATEDGANLLAGTRRAANILAAEERKNTQIAPSVDPDLFEVEEERNLYNSLREAETNVIAAVAAEEYGMAMGFMAELRRPIDAFFEAVMVNATDEKLRANRLALLSRIRATTGRVADFSRLEGMKG